MDGRIERFCKMSEYVIIPVEPTEEIINNSLYTIEDIVAGYHSEETHKLLANSSYCEMVKFGVKFPKEVINKLIEDKKDLMGILRTNNNLSDNERLILVNHLLNIIELELLRINLKEGY